MEAVEGRVVLFLPRAVKVYVATAPCNLRRNFDGLSNEVRAVLAMDPLSGHVFVFLNRRKTQVKLLLWTRGGFTILHHVDPLKACAADLSPGPFS